jgi:hypothetical protein
VVDDTHDDQDDPVDADKQRDQAADVEGARGVVLLAVPRRGVVVGTAKFAPLADMPMISTAPRFAAMNAKPVTHAGSDRPDRKKSMLLEIDLRAITPMLRTKTK